MAVRLLEGLVDFSFGCSCFVSLFWARESGGAGLCFKDCPPSFLLGLLLLYSPWRPAAQSPRVQCHRNCARLFPPFFALGELLQAPSRSRPGTIPSLSQ